MKIGKKVIIILITIFCCVNLILFTARECLMLPVNSYYKYSSKAFVIPEIDNGLIVQGLSYDSETDSFFITGYRKNKPSLLCVYNRKSKKVKKINLSKQNKEAFYGHVGGVAINGEYVYIAGGSECNLYVFSYDDIMNVENNGVVISCGTFDVAVNEEDYLGPAFLTVHNNELIVGEFYREQNYQTLNSHKITTNAGDYNQALALGFTFSDNDNAKFGLDIKPNKAYSIPDLVQGMCFADDKIFLSTSYGLAFSHIKVYDELELKAENTIRVLESEIPLYALDSNSIIKDLKIPPMSEEIEIVDGKMFTMCESASNKYIFGKFTSAKYCYASYVDKMLRK